MFTNFISFKRLIGWAAATLVKSRQGDKVQSKIWTWTVFKIVIRRHLETHSQCFSKNTHVKTRVAIQSVNTEHMYSDILPPRRGSNTRNTYIRDTRPISRIAPNDPAEPKPRDKSRTELSIIPS